MRVMFWLSRASAPLWWDSNYASNDPLLRPCTSCGIHLSICRIPGAHKAYCRAFELSTSGNHGSFLRRLSRHGDPVPEYVHREVLTVDLLYLRVAAEQVKRLHARI